MKIPIEHIETLKGVLVVLAFVTMPDGRILEKDVAQTIWKKDYKVSIGKE